MNLLELEAGFASGIGKGLNTAVVQETVAIESHNLYTRLECTLGDEGTDL